MLKKLRGRDGCQVWAAKHPALVGGRFGNTPTRDGPCWSLTDRLVLLCQKNFDVMCPSCCKWRDAARAA